MKLMTTGAERDLSPPPHVRVLLKTEGERKQSEGRVQRCTPAAARDIMYISHFHGTIGLFQVLHQQPDARALLLERRPPLG